MTPSKAIFNAYILNKPIVQQKSNTLIIKAKSRESVKNFATLNKHFKYDSELLQKKFSGNYT